MKNNSSVFFFAIPNPSLPGPNSPAHSLITIHHSPPKNCLSSSASSFMLVEVDGNQHHLASNMIASLPNPPLPPWSASASEQTRTPASPTASASFYSASPLASQEYCFLGCLVLSLHCPEIESNKILELHPNGSDFNRGVAKVKL